MFQFLTDASVVGKIIVWFGALCTLGIYSILYRENKFFRFFEHLFIGVATGYTIYTAWNDILKPKWYDPMTVEGRWWLAFLLPAGLLFYMVYSKKHNWMNRLVVGLFFGAASGQAFQGFANLYFKQIKTAASTPFINPPEVSAPGAYEFTPFSAAINNVLYLVIFAAVMTYFFFSFEQKGTAVKNFSKFGRYAMMLAFGAIFGNTIMARMSLLIGRIFYLIHDWAQVTILNQPG